MRAIHIAYIIKPVAHKRSVEKGGRSSITNLEGNHEQHRLSREMAAAWLSSV